jgi:hypothetical protein
MEHWSFSQREFWETLPVTAFPLHPIPVLPGSSFMAESLGALLVPDRPGDRKNRSSLTKFALCYQSM